MNTTAASVSSEYGRFPLHIACNNDAPLNVIKLIYNKFPEAIRIKDKFGAFPLNYCGVNCNATDLFLIEEYPTALANKYGADEDEQNLYMFRWFFGVTDGNIENEKAYFTHTVIHPNLLITTFLD